MEDARSHGDVTAEHEALMEGVNAIFGSLAKVGEAMNEASRVLSEAFAACDKIVKEAEANGRR